MSRDFLGDAEWSPDAPFRDVLGAAEVWDASEIAMARMVAAVFIVVKDSVDFGSMPMDNSGTEREAKTMTCPWNGLFRKKCVFLDDG